jgi:hypothetical protein
LQTTPAQGFSSNCPYSGLAELQESCGALSKRVLSHRPNERKKDLMNGLR